MSEFDDPDTLRQAFAFLKKNSQDILNYNRKTLQLYSPHPNTLQPQLISLSNFIHEHLFFVELLLPKSTKLTTQTIGDQALVREVSHNLMQELLNTLHSLAEEYPENTSLDIIAEGNRITLASPAFEPIVLSFQKAQE